MIHLIALTTLFSFASLAPPQETAPEIRLTADWVVGTRYELELVKFRKDFQGDELVAERTSTTPVRIEVLERSEDGYLFSWTNGKTEMPNVPESTKAVAQAMAGLVEGLELKLRMDEFGSFERLENEKEVLEKVEKAVDRIETYLSESGLEKALVAQVVGQARQMIGNEAFTQSMLKEPIAFYMPSGGRFVLGELEVNDDLIGNPFGGDPFPAKNSICLTELREEEGLARIDWTMKLDPEEATRILTETISEMAKRMGQDPPAADELPSFEIGDETVYWYDLTTGVPRSVVAARTIVSQGSKRVEGFRIETTWPERKDGE